MHEIVVLGAGYAGLTAATSLIGRTRPRRNRPAAVRVTLVDANERFTERIRLHQLAAGERLAELRLPDLFAGSAATLVTGRVAALRPAARTVLLEDGRTLSYDTLVYALGSRADTRAVAGAEDHAYTLDSAAEAARLAQRLTELGQEGNAPSAVIPPGALIQPSTVIPPSTVILPSTVIPPGAVVVCGAGLTGVEAAAEIAEQHPGLTVTLIGDTAPGATMAPRARAHLNTVLRRLGVRVISGVTILKVGPSAVTWTGPKPPEQPSNQPSDQPTEQATEQATDVPADVVVWTAGVRAPGLAAAAGLAVDDRGRIITDAALRSTSHPEVYAMGDAAAITQTYGILHGTCQSGMPTGVQAAWNIARALAGREPARFRFGYLHQAVSLGRGDAVVQFSRPDGSPGRRYLTGRPAVWYKETVTSSVWPSMARMLRAPDAGRLAWRRGGHHTR